MKLPMKKGFLDGCHGYGWLIALIGLLFSVVINLVSIATYSSRIEQSLTDVLQRVDRLEKQQDNYLRELRGGK